jgi:hypothetical protein
MSHVRGIVLLLFFLIGIDVFLLVATVGDLRPRSPSAIQALFDYQRHPNDETRKRWEAELLRMNREVQIKRTVGYSLLITNSLFIFYLGGKLTKRARVRTRT